MANLTPRTANVTRIFREASDSHMARGLAWYADANEVATALAVKNGVSVDVAAGVIAALSPLNGWGSNVNLAARFLATPGGLTSGYMGLGLSKARAIVAGADIVSTLNGDKISNFYRCIAAAGETDAVCIDRHALSLAVNTRYSEGNLPRVKGKAYAAIADVYKRATPILSREFGPLHAAQIQAVTWLAWRARFWSDGAFDSHAAVA